LPRHSPSLAWLLAALAAAPAIAQESSTQAVEAIEPGTPREPLPLWEAGLAGIAAWQPAYPGSDQNFARGLVLPYAIYRGSVLHVDGGGVGLRAFRSPRFDWDMSGSAAFGATKQVHAREGMRKLGTLVEIGPAVTINLGDLVDSKRDMRLTRLDVPIRAVFDVDDSFAHRGWTFEPRLSHTAWTGGGASLVLSASALFGNRSLNAMYYGVDAPDATVDRPAWRAKAGLVATRLGASLRHRIGPTLQLLYFAQVETVRGAANDDSPLVRRRQDGGFGVSLIWSFWHSTQLGAG
jgi:outer membrane scaffolding protein for murein synthesis (MipA/OmpV family)